MLRIAIGQNIYGVMSETSAVHFVHLRDLSAGCILVFFAVAFREHSVSSISVDPLLEKVMLQFLVRFFFVKFLDLTFFFFANYVAVFAFNCLAVR